MASRTKRNGLVREERLENEVKQVEREKKKKKKKTEDVGWRGLKIK